MKNLRFARLARLARLARPSTRKWDFRRRSRPRELAQRSQDDVSLNKLPQNTFDGQVDSRLSLSCSKSNVIQFDIALLEIAKITETTEENHKNS